MYICGDVNLRNGNGESRNIRHDREYFAVVKQRQHRGGSVVDGVKSLNGQGSLL